MRAVSDSTRAARRKIWALLGLSELPHERLRLQGTDPTPARHRNPAIPGLRGGGCAAAGAGELTRGAPEDVELRRRRVGMGVGDDADRRPAPLLVDNPLRFGGET